MSRRRLFGGTLPRVGHAERLLEFGGERCQFQTEHAATGSVGSVVIRRRVGRLELERQIALATRPIPQVVLAAGAERDDRRGAGNGRTRGIEPLNAQRAALGAGVVCIRRNRCMVSR